MVKSGMLKCIYLVSGELSYKLGHSGTHTPTLNVGCQRSATHSSQLNHCPINVCMSPARHRESRRGGAPLVDRAGFIGLSVHRTILCIQFSHHGPIAQQYLKNKTNKQTNASPQRTGFAGKYCRRRWLIKEGDITFILSYAFLFGQWNYHK